jgi:F-type H+-transporting ATPase subunit epsilon
MSTFHLTILTPEHTFFEGDVESLQFQTTDAAYGVLAGHQPEVVILTEGPLSITHEGETRRAVASDGLVTILPISVSVICQTIEWPENIDRARAEEDLKQAQEAMKQKESTREYTLARSMLARAMARLRVTDSNKV